MQQSRNKSQYVEVSPLPQSCNASYVYDYGLLEFMASEKIKALKTLVWHLLRETMKKKWHFWKNKQTVMYDEQVRTKKAKD